MLFSGRKEAQVAVGLGSQSLEAADSGELGGKGNAAGESHEGVGREVQHSEADEIAKRRGDGARDAWVHLPAFIPKVVSPKDVPASQDAQGRGSPP